MKNTLPAKVEPQFHPLVQSVQRPLVGRLHGFLQTKGGMFRCFDRGMRDLQTRRDEMIDLLKAVVVANTKYVNKTGHGKQKVETFDEIIKLLKRTKAPSRIRLQPKNAGAELACKSVEEVLHDLRNELASASGQLVRSFQQGLQYLTSVGQVGEITWHSKDVCRFSYFENEIIDQQVGNRRREGNQWKWKERRMFHNRRIVHDVMNARRLGVNSRIKKPERVQALIAVIPRWLKSSCHIVAGQEIRVSVEERSATVDEWENVEEIPRVESSYKYDPALVIGNYVLTAW